MVFNKRDLAKAFSPNKSKRNVRRRLSAGSAQKPSTSGSTTPVARNERGAQSSIKVLVRVRPHNDREMQDNFRTVVKIIDDKMLIFDPKEEENPFFYQGVVQKGRDLLKKQNKELQFIFDNVFNMSASNQDVFAGSTKGIISSLLEGYNCSVFAYGATGAGKTHTMLGKDGDPGITYLTMAELFSQIETQSSERDFNLGVSYLEVYNENVQDLLLKAGPLHVREDGRCGVIVAGLKIMTIRNAEELLALLAKGNRNRTQHPTDANAESSRSHAVFQVYVNITNKLDGQVKHVKLSMIDLAGSERASATGSKGARFKEGANINKSLLALGNCINNLADGLKHIPYRDSKLTRLLKDCLGGNCQTVMIANISPSSLSYEDTYNTLKYANRAKKIKTNVKKNIVSCQMHVTGYIKMVEEQKKEIELLKHKLLAFESGCVQAAPLMEVAKVTDQPDENMSEWSNQIIQLYERRRILNEKLLSLESTDKILCCRIQYKKVADIRLRNLTAQIHALTPEEQNASGKARVNKSMNYFKRQRDKIKVQMETVWNELCTVQKELLELQSQIQSKGIMDKLMERIELERIKIEKSVTQQQFDHAIKINSLQQCEKKSDNIIVHMMSKTLQTYYNMMRGYGTMTDQMKQEFKQLVKSLEGIRGIKWCDSDVAPQEEDFYSFTCLSVQKLADPTPNEPPVLPIMKFEDDEETNESVNTKLNSTFESSPVGPPELMENHNETVILDKKPKYLSMSDDDSESETTENGSIDTDKLNSTFNLHEHKAKKRVLTDTSETDFKTPVLKQMKRTDSGLRKTASLEEVRSNGKENKAAGRDKMSAKSVAILSRLKTGRGKILSSISNEALNTEGPADASLKAVRVKDKRGLMASSHPYSRPIPKSKLTTSVTSTRTPWL